MREKKRKVIFAYCCAIRSVDKFCKEESCTKQKRKINVNMNVLEAIFRVLIKKKMQLHVGYTLRGSK